MFGTKPNHWFGTSGMKHLTDVMNNGGETNHTFEEAFVCEKGEEHMGYKSVSDPVELRTGPMVEMNDG